MTKATYYSDSESVVVSATEALAPTHPARRATTVDRNPVVAAMITSNTLRNCNEVQDMVSKCMNSQDEHSVMCKTAQRYFLSCRNNV